MTRCWICKKEIDPDSRNTFRRIEGWEERRTRGGANTVHLRELVGTYAHGHCVDREKRKLRDHVGPGQRALL